MKQLSKLLFKEPDVLLAIAIALLVILANQMFAYLALKDSGFSKQLALRSALAAT